MVRLGVAVPEHLTCIVSKKNFFSWLDSLRDSYSLIGPVDGGRSDGIPGTVELRVK